MRQRRAGGVWGVARILGDRSLGAQCRHVFGLTPIEGVPDILNLRGSRHVFI